MYNVRQKLSATFGQDSSIHQKASQLKRRVSSSFTEGKGRSIKESISGKLQHVGQLAQEMLGTVGQDTSELGTRASSQLPNNRSITDGAQPGTGTLRSSDIAARQGVTNSKATLAAQYAAIKKARAITVQALAQKKGVALENDEVMALRSYEAIGYEKFNQICDKIDKRLEESTSPDVEMHHAQMERTAAYIKMMAEHRGVTLDQREIGALRDPSALGNKVFTQILDGIKGKIAKKAPKPLPKVPTETRQTHSAVEDPPTNKPTKHISENTLEKMRTLNEQVKIFNVVLNAVEEMALRKDNEGAKSLITDGDDSRLMRTLDTIEQRVLEASTAVSDLQSPVGEDDEYEVSEYYMEFDTQPAVSNGPKRISEDLLQEMRLLRETVQELGDRLVLSEAERMALREGEDGALAFVKPTPEGMDEGLLQDTLVRIIAKIDTALETPDQELVDQEEDGGKVPAKDQRDVPSPIVKSDQSRSTIAIESRMAVLRYKNQKHADNPEKLYQRLSEGLHRLENQFEKLEGGERDRQLAMVKKELGRMVEDAKLPPDQKKDLSKRLEKIGQSKIQKRMQPEKTKRVARSEINAATKANAKTAKTIAVKRERLHSLRQRRAEIYSQMKNGPMVELESIVSNADREKLGHLIKYREQLSAYEKDGTLPDKINPEDEKAVESWIQQRKDNIGTLEQSKVEEKVALADEKMKSPEVKSKIDRLNSDIASMRVEMKAIDEQIAPLEIEITKLTQTFQDSANYVANLTGQLNAYLSENSGNLTAKERKSIEQLVYQSYTTSVFLGNGSIPRKLSKQEFQLFAVLHHKAASTHAELNWDLFQDRKAKLDDDPSWSTATSFINNTALLIKNDILQKDTTQKEAISKYNGYVKVADLLLEQGCQEGAVAIKTGLGGASVFLIPQRNYGQEMSNQRLAGLASQDSYRTAHEEDAREGLTGMPFAGLYKTDREFAVTGSSDKTAAIRLLQQQASKPIEDQKRLRAAVQKTGTISPPSTSPLRQPIAELQSENDLYQRAKTLFPKQEE